MRHKINHEWPDDVQPMPEDNTSVYVNAQVAAWRRLGVLIHPQSAMEIAAWWQGPNGYGEDFAAFQSTGTITGDLLDAIDSEVPQYVAGLQEGTGSTLENSDCLAALHALRAYVVAVQELKGFLYIYATPYREDGFRFCVGRDHAGTVDGAYALFQTAEDAQLFAYAVQERDGCMVHVLPSAE